MTSATVIAATVGVGANLNPKPAPIVLTLPSGQSAALTAVTGDATLKPGSLVEIPGQQVLVPVRVKSFMAMSGWQGSVSFDASKLTFVQVEGYGLPGLTAANFSAAQTAAGKLTFFWNSTNNATTTVADNAQAFAVRFVVNAAVPAGSVLPVTLANAPTMLELLKADLTAASFITREGKVVKARWCRAQRRSAARS